jgi:hypothetical protein
MWRTGRFNKKYYHVRAEGARAGTLRSGGYQRPGRSFIQTRPAIPPHWTSFAVVGLPWFTGCRRASPRRFSAVLAIRFVYFEHSGAVEDLTMWRASEAAVDYKEKTQTHGGRRYWYCLRVILYFTRARSVLRMISHVHLNHKDAYNDKRQSPLRYAFPFLRKRSF